MITINGRIFENVYTGAEWASANPTLEDRVQGFDSTKRAFKMGDGVTAWNDLGYYYPYSDVFAGSIVDIPSGTPLTGDPGYFDIDYSSFIAGHGPNPGVFVLLVITPDIENQIIYDVPVSSISSTQLDTLRVYPHVDPSDPTKSIDDIIILIK